MSNVDNQLAAAFLKIRIVENRERAPLVTHRLLHGVLHPWRVSLCRQQARAPDEMSLACVLFWALQLPIEELIARRDSGLRALACSNT